MTVVTEIEGILGAELFFRTMPQRSNKAMALALNQTMTRKGMRSITDEMYGEVNFPTGYLKGDRIGITKYARDTDLEVIVRGRKRATSLARFAAPGTPLGTASKAGVRVKVKTAGGGSLIRKAWLVRLRKGASITEDNYNIGLAVYVKAGDSIIGKHSAHQAWLNPQHTVALLYGPSVDQVFKGVINEGKVSGQILTALGEEYFRQFDRLGR